MQEPRLLAESTESHPHLPEGTEERFSGYGVMGLPFRSGHVLALRRFSASSIGPGYTSVWHRSPSGEWTIYQNVSAELACPRYFGPGLRQSLRRTIDLRWTGPDTFSVEVDGGRAISWEMTLASPGAVRTMNTLAGLMPRAMWRNETALRAMGGMARRMLGTGRLALAGVTPSGQHFVANPFVAWTIPFSRARVDGVDLGEVGPLAMQERLGDFWIPQRGLFVVGQSFFEPFDPVRHRRELHAGEGGRNTATAPLLPGPLPPTRSPPAR